MADAILPGIAGISDFLAVYDSFKVTTRSLNTQNNPRSLIINNITPKHIFVWVSDCITQSGACYSAGPIPMIDDIIAFGFSSSLTYNKTTHTFTLSTNTEFTNRYISMNLLILY